MRNRISQSIARFSCYILSIPFLAAAPVYAVTLSPADSAIGDEANWHISDKALIISGKGATYRYDAFDIYDAESDGRPWDEYRESIESVIVEEGITKIGNYLFANLPNLKSVSVADSVVSIGSYCFADCPNLTEIQVPSEAGLGTHLFDGDSALFPNTDFQVLNGNYLYAYTGEGSAVVTVPDGIEIIGANCFDGHSEITKVLLPGSLRTVGGAAWIDCANLKEIIIPDSVTQIGLCAFANCTSLSEISIPSGLNELDMHLFFNCTALQSVEFSGYSLHTLASGCFANCSSLQNISVPESVTHIEQTAFSGCSALKSVTGLKAAERIEADAFQDCVNLQSTDISPAIRYISPTAFSGCDLFEKLHTADGAFIIDKVFIRCLVNDPVYHIPEGITAIMNDAFSDSRIVAVWFPESVQYIHDDAFVKCSYLTDLYGTPNSAAEQYAAINGIGFRDENAALPQGRDMTLDYTADGWYFGNSGAVFGGDYYLSDTDRQYLSDLGIGTNSDQTWGGSCTGLAITVILAKNGVFSPSQFQAGTETISEVKPTEDVVSFINYYQCIQDRGRAPESYEPDYLKFYRMLNIAKNIPCGESPFLLTFATQSGSHAVVGYGLESGKWVYNGKTYDGRILVWDSNYPKALNDDSCLYFDSQTFDYCIPHYGVHVAEGVEDNTAGIITVCNDIDVLNAYPYPFNLHYQKGDLNCDGIFSVADVILLVKHLTVQTTLTDSQMQLADLSGDEKVNAIDLTLLKRIMLSPAIT